jgi:hypothetical protein
MPKSKPVSLDELRRTAEQIAGVIENPRTSSDVRFRMREECAAEMDEILDKLDKWHVESIRHLYPVLKYLQSLRIYA